MKFLKGIIGAMALAAFATLVPSSSAQTLKVLTVGSSAQFGPFAAAAYDLAAAGGATEYHYTVKSGSCLSGSTTCYASVADSRNSSIQNGPGNLWVIWSTNGIWAYLSVDSTVGVRAFSAVPRATLALAALSSLPVSSTTNYDYWKDGTNDTALTTTVYDALSGTKFTAANTDIRPEDALFATNRALNTLGYGDVKDTRSGHSGQYLVGYDIESYFNPTTDYAQPVSFAIGGGADPFSDTVGPAEITIPVGAAPIIFLANTLSGSTVASATNINSNAVAADNNAALLFSGLGDCADSLVTGATGLINPILREPTSGTMNTTEYTVFLPGDPSTGYSQETGITGGAPGTSSNPLHLPCPSTSTTNYRERAVGTGDEVNAVIATTDSIGYAFFSYESVNGGSSTSKKTYKYITLNGIDPINTSYSVTSGILPYCPVVDNYYNCSLITSTLGASFPNLRNGDYKAWSIYRVITDSTGETNAQALVTEAEKLVDTNFPDFVPFSPICGATKATSDPGLKLYREHFVPSTIETIPDTITITPDDGALGATVSCGTFTLLSYTLGGTDEAGGDVGGTPVGPNTTQPTYPGTTETGNPH
jgi:hypothetical protein